MNRLLCAFLLASFALGADAHANVAPPPFTLPSYPLPVDVIAWFLVADAALQAKDLPKLANLCWRDGFEDNLVGRGGTSLKALFSDAAADGAHLATDFSRHWVTIGGDGAIVQATLHDPKTRSARDIYVLLVADPQLEGQVWRALGAGSDFAAIMKLMKRRLARVEIPDTLK